MKYELATVEKEISPENLNDTFNNKPNLKVNKTQLRETDQIFNLPITQLVRYKYILNYYSGLFKEEYYRVTRVMKDHKILNDQKISNYVIIHYKGLLNLYNEEETCMPDELVDLNFRFHDDIKENITRQIKHSLQIQFVLPLKSMIEDEFRVILIDEGYLDSPEKSFFDAIRTSEIVIEYQTTTKTTKAKTRNNTSPISLQFNSFNSIDKYTSNLAFLFGDFKKSIQQHYPVAVNHLDDLEKLSAHKCTLREVFARFHQDPSKLTRDIPCPLFSKMDALINLERELPPELSSEEIDALHCSLNKFTTAQYHFTKNAIELIDQRIELVMFSGLPTQVSESMAPLIQESPLLKINTQLSVPQITYLFRCLNMERGILQEKTKAGLFRKIAAYFTSSRKDHISVDSIRNNFNIPEENAIEFWIEKFTHLMQLAKKDRENFRR
jgi:hypothetical protein